MNIKKWTDVEIKTLHDYAKDGIEKLKNKLPERSEQAIRTKCCYMGIYIGETSFKTERLFMVM